jgi:hypothetical protein
MVCITSAPVRECSHLWRNTYDGESSSFSRAGVYGRYICIYVKIRLLYTITSLHLHDIGRCESESQLIHPSPLNTALTSVEYRIYTSQKTV